MIFLYNIFISLFHLGIRTVAPWNEKAREWITGRRDLWKQLEHDLPRYQNSIWFHVASAGEFEQGKPLMEALKMRYADHPILVSFFSPSGYKVAQTASVADYIFYLPLDTRANAEHLLRLMKPKMAVFIKYDLWYQHVKAIERASIPSLLVSAVFRKHQVFFKWYGGFYKHMLPSFKQLFVQDAPSLQLLKAHGITNGTMAGDTRVDRVLRVKNNVTEIPHIKEFIGNAPVLVAGSTWLEDELLLKSLIEQMPGLTMVIAPHEIEASRLRLIKTRFEDAVFYSQLLAGTTSYRGQKVLIIDNVGMLSRLYRYATVALIGGGFTRDGIHNALEAAVFGKPLIWGPNYRRYTEAIELVEAGAAQPVETSADLQEVMARLLDNPSEYEKASNAALDYVEAKGGATQKIMNYIQENRLLTS